MILRVSIYNSTVICERNPYALKRNFFSQLLIFNKSLLSQFITVVLFLLNVIYNEYTICVCMCIRKNV